jgi:hypothetical protein
MADEQIFDSIKQLIDEERALRSTGQPVDKHRLDSVEATLDQCWDLLRQRRAQRESGSTEVTVAVRDVDTVEHYQQ